MVSVPFWVSGLVTTTSLAPALSAGVVAVRLVALPKTTLVAAVPSIVTVAPLTNPVPLMVMLVPPAVGPLLGLIEVTVGAAT